MQKKNKIPIYFKRVIKKIRKVLTRLKKIKPSSFLPIIQYIIDKKKPRVYLEIGVNKGATFQHIKGPKLKIGVDPNFLISKLRIKTPNLRNKYFEITSDEFFKNEKKLLETKGLNVVFIDGLHTYEQSLEDVKNSLKFIENKGVIVLHDCNPPEEVLADPSRPNGLIKGWCGNVWKTIVHLRSLYEELNVFVVDIDVGLGIVTLNKPKNTLEFDESEITKLSYKDLDANRKDFLNLKSEKYFKQYIDAYLKS